MGFIGYPATTFVQNHFDYKVDGLDINVMVNWQLPPVADPDLSQVCVCVGGGGGGVGKIFTCPDGFCTLCQFFFFPQNKGPGPLP